VNRNSLYLESEKDEEVEKLYKIWDSVTRNDMDDRKSQSSKSTGGN
jgi:hypothetical protein